MSDFSERKPDLSKRKVVSWMVSSVQYDEHENVVHPPKVPGPSEVLDFEEVSLQKTHFVEFVEFDADVDSSWEVVDEPSSSDLEKFGQPEQPESPSKLEKAKHAVHTAKSVAKTVGHGAGWVLRGAGLVLRGAGETVKVVSSVTSAVGSAVGDSASEVGSAVGAAGKWLSS